MKDYSMYLIDNVTKEKTFVECIEAVDYLDAQKQALKIADERNISPLDIFVREFKCSIAL